MSSYASDPLYQQVAQQVAAEIAAAQAPIQRQIDQTQQDQAGALAAIGNLFSGLQPAVERGTQFVQQSYDQALANERGIYDAANARLAGMREQRAGEAQQMAQMIGGPVAVGEFTAGVEPAQQYLAQSGAGQLLHSLGLAQAGVQEAEAFSGKVFPLLRTEQEADARNQFSKQIASLRGQMSDLEGQRMSAIDQRFFQRQQAERQYELDKKDQELSAIKANRDWKATLRSLAQDQQRIDLAKAESRRAESVLTGKYKGKPTLEAKTTAATIAQNKRDAALREKEINANIAHQTVADKQEAARLGLSARELAVREWEMKNNAKLANAKRADSQRLVAMQLVDAATNPAQGKPITQTVTTEVDRTTALLNKGYGIKDPQTGETRYFIDRKVTVPASQVPAIQDPQKLYELLLGYRIPAKMAEAVVESKLGTPNFTPGKVDYTKQELQSMPFSQLRGVAIKVGFNPNPSKPRTKKYLVNYVLKNVKKSGAR